MRRRDRLLHTLLDTLDSLPKSNADQVARELALKHYSGRPADPLHCPLARYLKVETGEDWAVHCDSEEEFFYLLRAAGRDLVVNLDAFPAIVDFIRLFDNQEWPNLIAATP